MGVTVVVPMRMVVGMAMSMVVVGVGRGGNHTEDVIL
jgi:hypothetical protein